VSAVKPARTAPLYLLCIDHHAGTITRYRKKPGLWRGEKLQQAKPTPPEAMNVTGRMLKELEYFRNTGDANVQ